MDNHDELMKKHQARREVNFVPYHERRSTGDIKYSDEGNRVKVEIEVAGLGTMTVYANARYSENLRAYHWDLDAQLSASLSSPIA